MRMALTANRPGGARRKQAEAMSSLALASVWANVANPPHNSVLVGWRAQHLMQNWPGQPLLKWDARAIMIAFSFCVSTNPIGIRWQGADWQVKKQQTENISATPFHPFLRLNTLKNVTRPPNSMQASDESLVEAAQKGDLQAFLALYDRYLPVVYNRVRYTVPVQDVEDVTQEVFFALMKSLNNFQGKSRFSTWVRSLVNHRVADYYRSRRPPEEALDPDLRSQPTSHTLHSDGREHGSDDLILIRSALYRLPEKYREVLLLRFADGLQFSEVAEQMGLSLDAAKSLFRRAIVALRKEWEELNA